MVQTRHELNTLKKQHFSENLAYLVFSFIKLFEMNSLIEKVLYLAPECRYSGLEFTGQLSYHELFISLSSLFT